MYCNAQSFYFRRKKKWKIGNKRKNEVDKVGGRG
jgi:hypothetical protein